MYLTQYCPILAGFVDTQSNHADLFVDVEFRFCDPVSVESTDNNEIVRQFFKGGKGWVFQIGVFEEDFNGCPKKPIGRMLDVSADET